MSRRILTLEGEEGLARTLAEGLEASGLPVLRVQGANAALWELREGPVDLLITDPTPGDLPLEEFLEIARTMAERVEIWILGPETAPPEETEAGIALLPLPEARRRLLNSGPAGPKGALSPEVEAAARRRLEALAGDLPYRAALLVHRSGAPYLAAGELEAEGAEALVRGLAALLEGLTPLRKALEEGEGIWIYETAHRELHAFQVEDWILGLLFDRDQVPLGSIWRYARRAAADLARILP